jgi:hypothetical protein
MAQNKRLYLNIFKRDFLFVPIPLSLQISVLQARILSLKGAFVGRSLPEYSKACNPAVFL